MARGKLKIDPEFAKHYYDKQRSEPPLKPSEYLEPDDIGNESPEEINKANQWYIDNANPYTSTPKKVAASNDWEDVDDWQDVDDWEDVHDEDKGLVRQGLEAFGRGYERYVTAPARAGVSKIIEGDIAGSPAAWGDQFGQDPSLAPTGKDLSLKMGASDKILDKPGFLQKVEADELAKYGDQMAKEDPSYYQKMKQRASEKTLNASPADLYGAGLDFVVDPAILLSTETGAKALSWGPRKIGGKLGSVAEKFALNATGATGKQVSEFKPGAGRELLDRKIVRFGDSQAKIADRARQAVEVANSQIDTALRSLQESGATVDANDVYRTIREKINQMRANPAQADIANLMEKELDNLVNATDAKGTTKFGILDAENIKRGYNRKAGNWMDPEKGQAGKELYRAWKNAVEKSAGIDPRMSELFKEGKRSYGILAPIEESAQRRAFTTSQSPPIGFLDVVSGGMGAASSGPGGAVVAPIARRILAPRLSSSAAVTADKASKILKHSGKLGPAIPAAGKLGQREQKKK